MPLDAASWTTGRLRKRQLHRINLHSRLVILKQVQDDEFRYLGQLISPLGDTVTPVSEKSRAVSIAICLAAALFLSK